MNLHQFVTMRGYQKAAAIKAPALIDAMLGSDDGDRIREDLKLKRIQFDTSENLWMWLNQTCELLDCSKRDFLEMAISEALKRSEEEYEKAFQRAVNPRVLDDHSVEGV